MERSEAFQRKEELIQQEEKTVLRKTKGRKNIQVSIALPIGMTFHLLLLIKKLLL